ncbi:ABC transporter permease subunit [Labrys monachus]|uniref:Thiamine transport system permease protein n=1 Tax=Labrys monachus TaxID=217067 RepID=A0ABU0FI05_9HYPH|nr:ABC transporter permease subunit [Labrys monachus]MDQ0394241.1 thiamine transport system permease protein [Labrys monachus]
MTAGLALLAALAAIVLAALASLFFAAGAGPWQGNGAYLLSIAGFTLYQAALSTVLSLLFGGLVALALARRRFRGQRVLLALFGVATALPAIVAVFAFAGILGRAGAANRLLEAVGLPGIPIYGLTGILLVHVFFNGAFAARVLLAALEAVPGEHWRLASALGMPSGAVFRLIDWPVMRRDMPALALLVFIACATSFTIPLTLGGGPGSATFEVAIYQAIHSDADFGRAALLALMQIGAMAILVGLAAPLLATAREGGAIGRRIERPDRQGLWLRLQDGAVLGAAALLVLPPLAAVAAAGRGLLGRLDARVPQALATSLAVAFLAAALSLAAALVLSRARGALAAAGSRGTARLVGIAPLLTLATPPLALAAGLYVIARWLGLAGLVAMPALILVNAMMALPFVHRLVDPPMALAQARYGRLADSLGMAGLTRLRLIEWPLLGPSAAAAFAFAMALSLGDLGVVALFGSEGLVTLPSLLYAKLGSYRIAEADGIAALLAGLVLILFLAADLLGRRHARDR